MYLDLIDETELLTEHHVSLVEDILQFSGRQLQLPENIECAVTFVDNKRIQEINREYRQKDYPTDVISFALDDNAEDELFLDEDTFPHHLGDIIISIDKAKEQAQEYGHSFERELGFLALHGFLHLNGYDHIEEDDEKEMFALQNQLLSEYGLLREGYEKTSN